MHRSRIAAARLHHLLRQFPTVAILGARQVGKSTLARTALPAFALFDLEDDADLRRVGSDPTFLLEQHRKLVLDEAQRLPEIFPLLRSYLDKHPSRKVVLLGSASPDLVGAISESLGGRVGFLELFGISVLEHSAEALWINGAFPRVHWSRPRAKPVEWYPAYLRTCLEQDIPQLGFRVSSMKMRNLLTMIAHTQGGLCNLSELGGSLGIDYHSVAHMLDILEGVFLVRRVAPYFANIGKRLVKSPKVYIRDTGLLHALLGIAFDKRALLAHPKAGASFETFCLEQIVLHARLADPSSEAYFFRTHAGAEVDLLLKLRGRLVPIEIKLGVTPPDTRGLASCMRDLDLGKGYVVSWRRDAIEIARGVVMCSLGDLLAALRLVPQHQRHK